VPHGRGYGGLFANAAALAEVLRDLLRDDSRLLGAEAKEQMFTVQRTDEEPIAMTLGWVIGSLNGVQYFGKQGGGLGFHGNLRLYRERGLATVLIANRTELSAGPIDARSDELDAAFLAGKP
jgi:D-alanyl-D-alanine carboxypeptidase